MIQFNKYLTLSKLLNVAIYVVEFVNKQKMRDTDSFMAAQTHLIRVMQQQSSWEELEYLQNPSRSAILQRLGSINLFLDKEGEIHSKRTIGKVSVYEYEIVNPILIAKNHQLISLIVLDYHHQCMHLGIPSTVNKVRLSGYWIL